MAHTYSHLFRLPTTGLRFFTVYGPWGRPDMAPFKFVKAITEGRGIDIYNHGRQMRDFTYVDDIVESTLRVLDKPAQPDPDFDRQDPRSSTSFCGEYSTQSALAAISGPSQTCGPVCSGGSVGRVMQAL